MKYYLLLANVSLHSIQRQQSVFRPAKNINTKFTAFSSIRFTEFSHEFRQKFSVYSISFLCVSSPAPQL